MLSRFSSRLTAAAVTRVLGASTVVSQPTHFTVVNMSTTSSVGPIQQRMEEKIRAALSPTELIIENESHLHRHHAPMQGVNSTETHFRMTIVSEAFHKKTLMQRHRMVYKLVEDEMSAEGGVHALALTTKTPDEYQKV